ncbi:Aminopeptidase YpdF [subsurface metagenome]|nr:M24 family metallopeptidase [Clostridia bacterium]
MVDRLGRLREILKQKRIGGFLITSPSNLFYLSGFRAEGSFALVTRSEAKIFVPELLYKQAKEIARNFEVMGFRNKLWEKLGKFLTGEKIRRLGFEAGGVSIKRYKEMEKAFRRIRLVPLDSLVEGMRIVKTEEEVGLIRKSAQLCVAAFRFIKKRIKIGMKEKIIACQLEYFMKKRGAQKPSFEIIVASGENTAYPHHQTGERKIRSGDCLLIDMGCVYKGYCSDLTRPLFLGIITNNSGKSLRATLSFEFKGKYKKIYQVVRKAQRAAIGKIRPGVRCSSIDSAARKTIARAGLGNYFIHRTGHGIGLDVHELPWVEENSKQVLRTGMILTVEPGVYIPGFGGMRIEDMVLVTKKGCEILTEG